MILMPRFSPKLLIAGGLTFSTTGLFLLSQLSAGSGYLDLLIPLLAFGFGNGIAFVPLTSVALRGVDQQDAGAASGLVNVMQQVGGALGLAVLVTVFGTVSRTATSPAGASAAQAAQHAFVVGADRGFLVAASMLAATVLVSLVAIRPVVRTPRQVLVPSAA